MPVLDSTDLANIAAAVWNAARASYTTSGSFGERTQADVTAWKGSTPQNLTSGYVQVDVEEWVGSDPPGTGGDGNLLVSTSSHAGIADAVWSSTIEAPGTSTGNRTYAEYFGEQLIRSGTTQAGSATTVTLDAGASANTDAYKGLRICIVNQTQVLQARLCTAYNGTTKVATVDSAWDTNPGIGNSFVIYPNFASSAGGSGPSAATIAAAVWDEARSGHTTSGTFGERVLADIQKWVGSTPNSLISGKVDANAQVVGDKTGYSLTATPPTLSAIVNGIWDELQSGHVTAGTFGKFFDVAISSRAAPSDVPTANANADALLDRASAIDGFTVRQAIAYIAACVVAKCAGEPNNPVTFKGLNGTTDRVTSTIDANGNRTNVTLS